MKKISDEKWNGGAVKAFGKACLNSCQKALTRLAAVKEAILRESSQAVHAPERLLRLAVNEAEAIAWQTNYPHLLFPTLAAEKVQEVARWADRQENIGGGGILAAA